jgi:hypothetical protein
MSDADSQFWDTTYSQVPSWAFFHRQQISADDMHAQEDAEQSSTDVFEALIADADEGSIIEKEGVQSLSATFRVTKQETEEEKRPWWVRVARKSGRSGALNLCNLRPRGSLRYLVRTGVANDSQKQIQTRQASQATPNAERLGASIHRVRPRRCSGHQSQRCRNVLVCHCESAVGISNSN